MSVALATAASTPAYWFLTRGTGAVTLLLLTVSVVIGVLGSLRFSATRWPRFAIEAVHRDVSLLVIVVLVVHIITSVLDSFAPIAVTAAVIPFISSYRPLWLGLGALSFDLLLAVVITSLVRRRLGYGRWRAVHWLAYASWPVAVLHGLGTGSDTKLWWMLALTAVCVAAVAVAACVRVARAERALSGLRAPAFALSVLIPVGLAGFALAGPLRRGWARRAGTPSHLLARASPHATPTRVATTTKPASPPKPFTAVVRGSLTQSQSSGGAIVDISLRLSGGAHGRLRVRLGGTPLSGGGLSMTGSQVDLIANGYPSALAGSIQALQGTEFVSRVRSGDGAGLTLHARLNIDAQTNAVTGRLQAVR
ncbi:MAG: ferric reductase-like transmembrane domain-containing protein [Solirubrobacteraceae bacterium]